MHKNVEASCGDSFQDLGLGLDLIVDTDSFTDSVKSTFIIYGHLSTFFTFQ